MKKIIILPIISISILFGEYSDSCGTNQDIIIDIDKYFFSKGWSTPLNRKYLITDIAYNYDSGIYKCRFGYRHGAVDIDASVNEKVYAIDDGEVIDYYRDNTSETKNISIVYIKHRTLDGKEFLGIYGHTYLKNGLTIGSMINKGEEIGFIKKYNNPHIHFSISTDIGSHNTSSWGSIKNGITNPLDFLEKNINDFVGIFDGAGSLVSPTENIAGGNYDIALMHSHLPYYNSTAVFQWLYDEDYCSQIDLFSYPTNLDVVVKAKGWNEHLIQKAFKVTLNAYGSGGGITLKRPDIENDWTTLAVTSQKPIDKKIKIIAICKKSSEPFNQGNRVNIEKPNLVDVTHDYYWTGTGSIISILENRNFDSAGVGLDYAVTLKDSKHKSFTSFQWYASDSCSQLKIKGYNENKSSVNEVKIKLWDAKDWSDTMCGTSLPCVISAPKLDRYYIIKVKSEPDAIKSGYLKAECIQ